MRDGIVVKNSGGLISAIKRRFQRIDWTANDEMNWSEWRANIGAPMAHRPTTKRP